MNSLDLFDYTVPIAQETISHNTDGLSSASQPTLNDEVNEVIGQLGKFWGGFRKQSQTVFESARKDFGQVVSQAQKELGKLGAFPATSEEDSSVPASEYVSEELDSQDKSEESNDIPQASTSTSSSSSFLSRLQSSFPPTLTPAALSSTLQWHLPQHLQQGLNLENASADFAQLRATLAENIQRVQHGTTLQQAEKLAEQYMQKGGTLVKEAGDFLRDAVKIVPPDEADGTGSGVIWDGSDVWTMQDINGPSNKGKGKEKQEPEVLFSVPRAGRRTDILLHKLRTDPEELRKDPASDDDPVLWTQWIALEMEANGGLEGDFWKARITEVLSDKDNEALKALLNKLVPSELSTETFWTRYFYRVHKIGQEEEKRRALLEGAKQEGEDEFTWEDEEDEHATPVATSEGTSGKDDVETTTLKGKTSGQLAISASAAQSPRESEDSYDVVSSVSASGDVSSCGVDPKSKAKTEDGDDSDWE